ncbi:type III secretion system outer membrane ring subunit SctC [Acerihabitans sp. TG2]|uniref:type III secretion system outer membrane ring subunit SctC n=1 Tax=Acerihabitans sp. TG2 TaxID=3096008 RepID=UPI002B238CC1|nr:type III secretion system outer membrane ring subunit SctC [Acerihabitans sp. TG2]MEA9389621.1 type III secretion system outer membrane ring subunit SctC [Acerihabitans sp. TG2]
MKYINLVKVSLFCGCLLGGSLPGLVVANPLTADGGANSAGYVANKDGLKIFFDAVSSRLGKPVIVSKLAARKNISGEFDFNDPQALLEKISQQLGLIWYFDGQAIYVYEASEIRNSVISLNNITLNTLDNFLRKSGLYDKRFPLKGDNSSGTFYISGPPVYVDLVINTAKFMDEQPTAINSGETAAVIQLSNTFVGDRSFDLRGEKVTIPGIATVIEQLLRGGDKAGPGTTSVQRLTSDSMPAPQMPEFTIENISAAGQSFQPRSSLAEALRAEAVAGPISVIANPDTNSLLVKGTPKQVQLVTNLVSALDMAKRHVELSLWIVDIQKEELDSLGVSWQGGVNIGSQLGVNFNGGSYSTLDGTRFVASINALAQKNRANIVSRPVVLTQENVPAIFDNNRTFYTQLIGERTVDLQHVTYGTMVSVLPRFAAGDQIEMVLNIEDGNEVPNDQSSATILPKVGRTKISTVARVPKGKSLLVGGYTRDETSGKTAKIPVLGNLPLVGGLFSYKQESQSNTVRIFLIQPREINEPINTDTGEFVQQFINNRQPSLLADWSRNFLEGQKWQ